MPNGARVLRFRSRSETSVLPPSVAYDRAKDFLNTPLADRDSSLIDSYLSQPDVLLAVIGLLREDREISPSSVAAECERIYEWLKCWSGALGLFDERAYFSGESGLLVGNCCRLLGRREEADLWFDRAEAAFRKTVNPNPSLANVAYARLGLKYDRGEYDYVLEFLPDLKTSFEQARMSNELLKCRFLEAATLKSCDKRYEAREVLRKLNEEAGLLQDRPLKGRVLMSLGEIEAWQGRNVDALVFFQQALQYVDAQPIARAHLKGLIGESLRGEGRLAEAAEAYRASIQDYESLNMKTWSAYLRVVLSETLIAANRPREAEWEILAALPTIEEQKMVPEGFAAVALLKESVRRRKTDPEALRQLREQLQSKS